MKTFTIISVAVLTLSVNFLFASNDGASVNSNANLTSVISLAPSTPATATFEEVTTPFEFASLAPVTPSEASFDDATEDIAITSLAPVTPIEADFNDITAQYINMSAFAPVAPAVADFE